MSAVMWFRRDLRLADNPALVAADGVGPVVGLFVLDPRLLASAGRPRLAFLRDSLADLDVAMDGNLVVRLGDPAVVVPAVARAAGAADVFVAKDFTPYGRRRDQAVSDALAADGRRLRGVGSPYVIDPGTVVKQDGSGYAVFTAFWRAWSQLPSRPSAPHEPEVAWAAVASDRVDWSSLLGGDEPAPSPVTAGESAAAERWAWFRDHALGSYAAGRDAPAVDGTSKLSSYLRWGTVHPRQLLGDLDGSEGADAFRRQLCWRDFYADILFRHPASAWANLDPRYDAMELDTDDRALDRFAAWREGRTGFGFVDAGMRQLEATGWMHNRVRMITASFLVKDLHLPWQWGARHFLDRLVDGEVANNNHGWQWVAGSGTDAAPYHRIFNPTAQAQRFDPSGDYVRHWLAGRLPVAPVVDHAAERLEALRRRAALRPGG